jgi:predicted nucleic-acid-binding Zn-ribbon protein
MSEGGPSQHLSMCPECGGGDLYQAATRSGGHHEPMLLPHLNTGFLGLKFPMFDVIVCADCGLTRFFAEPDARERMRKSEGWRRVE